MNPSFKRSAREFFKIGWKAFVLGVMMSILSNFVIVRVNEADTVYTLKTMKYHLEKVSPLLSSFCRDWAKKNNYPTWLCGPTSYALAVSLNKKYFESKLPIVLDRLPGQDCIQLVMGVYLYPLGNGNYRVMDHVWIQIYWRNLVIMVDPTYSQFDHRDKIIFAWFKEDEEGSREMRTFLNLLRLQEISGPVPGGFDNSEMYRDYIRNGDVLRRIFQNDSVPRDWRRWSSRIRKIME